VKRTIHSIVSCQIEVYNVAKKNDHAPHKYSPLLHKFCSSKFSDSHAGIGSRPVKINHGYMKVEQEIFLNIDKDSLLHGKQVNFSELA
jgi:hypothetical protein